MTCFWKGIITALGNDRIKKVLGTKMGHQKKINVVKFVQSLKKNNTITDDVLCEDMELNQQLKQDNYKHVANLDIKKINMGYDCSTCDPFLLLICQLFEINIQHQFNGVTIDYTNKKVKNKSYKLNFGSDTGHFWSQ
ncbi:MAG: hypothetical protein Edafosvirus34_5 [Edafosvirus sp.]|uniref:Uncharacterized protein n=1 Tax=Edafosvirus sp. TaxID=2487765 RepID=A0A3G4ZV80_9VIRU|nr:MAG: hypothetical protein Edafosvirus34_5 [Edafosvirus sp.]